MLLIVDGNNTAIRSAYKLSLSRKDGTDVSVLFGFLRSLQSTMEKYHPSSILVAFDGGTPSFRRALVPTYKAHRTKDSNDRIDWESVWRQISLLEGMILPVFGVQVVRARHVEADDLIAAACKLATEPVMVLSMDDDLLQLVSRQVSVIQPTKKRVINKQNFLAHMDIHVGDYVLYKTLIGDGSDGVPGVKSIGPVAAKKLIDYWTHNDIDFADNGMPLNKRQKQALLDVGEDTFWAMYDCMDLSVDRVGAHKVVFNAPHAKAAVYGMRSALQRNEFISMMDGHIYGMFGRLVKPVFEMAYFPKPFVDRTAI